MAHARALVPPHIRCRPRRCPQLVQLPAHRRSCHSHRVRARACLPRANSLYAAGIACPLSRFVADSFLSTADWLAITLRFACARAPQSFFTRILSNSSAQLRKTWQHIGRTIWLPNARHSLCAAQLKAAFRGFPSLMSAMRSCLAAVSAMHAHRLQLFVLLSAGPGLISTTFFIRHA